MEQLQFKIASIRFAKDGFYIVKTENGESVSGKFAAQIGMMYDAQGAWDSTSPGAQKFGPTFKVQTATALATPSVTAAAPSGAESASSSGAPDVLTFQVEQIVVSKNGFHVIRTTDGDTASGFFIPRPGHIYKARGTWDRTSERALRWGPSFQVESAEWVQLQRADDIGRFLILHFKGKGLGEAVIRNLCEACKSENLDLHALLDQEKRDILVECVGTRNAKKIDMLLAEWPKIKPQADLISPLLGYGLTESQAETMVGLYGQNAVRKVEDEPYELILRLDGVGFMTADKIAMKIGRIKKDDPIRMRAALSAAMREATNNGDLGVERSELLDKSLPLVNESYLEGGKRKLTPGVPLTVPLHVLSQMLDDMIAGRCQDADGNECGFSSHVIEFADEKGATVVWYAPLVHAESAIARRIKAFNAAPAVKAIAKLPEIVAASGLKLAPEQQLAIETALTKPVTVITGGPGRGKSAILKVLLKALKSTGSRGFQGAPTGKAAKRISQATGDSAQTLHSLLGYRPGGGCEFNEEMPLPADYLIIDEASMADTELMAAALCAVPNTCRIIIVGDVDQLPSVGPGQVLRDLIRSGVVSVVRLTKVFRTDAMGINMAAEDVNAGRLPSTSEDGTFEYIETDKPADELLRVVKDLLAEGVNPDDIQVLSPRREGAAGCSTLNKMMQELLNPLPEHATNVLRREAGSIGIGDRVMQHKNDKETGLVNGDIAWVHDIAQDASKIVIALQDDNRKMELNKNQTSNLTLAYASTVHKSQGAEAPYVLICMDSAAQFGLRRSMLYTALTRGKTKVKIMAPRRTLMGGLRKGEPPEGTRRTSLVSKLHAHFGIQGQLSLSRQAPASAMDLHLDDVPF